VGLGNGLSTANNVSSGVAVTQFSKHNASVNKVLRINSQNLATASNDASVKLWNLASGAYICSFNHSSPVKSMAVLPNGLLATGTCDSKINLWNLTSGVITKTLTGHSGCVTDLQFNPLIGASGSLASSADGSTFIVYDLASSYTNVKQITNSISFNCLLILPLGQIVVGYTKIGIVDTSFNILANTNTPSSIPVLSMALMLDGVTIACGLSDNTIRLFSTSSYSFTGVSLTGHTQQVNSLELIVLSPYNLPFLISGSSDGSVMIWNMTSNAMIKTISMNSSVYSVAILYNETDLSNNSI
jgi:WD40 repeat protein